MVSLKQNQCSILRQSKEFQKLKKEMLGLLMSASREIQGIRGPTELGQKELQKRVQQCSENRGRDLFYPFLGSGLGQGPFVELLDGSVKYDLINGIGIHFFGHSYPPFMEEVLSLASADIMQGNLQPGLEMQELLEAILSRVGENSRLAHAWMMCSGTMVNEVALKIIRQKKHPATQIVAFQNCFAGRSTAMQEITDNPNYRQGQPTYGEVHYLPFYQPEQGLEKSIHTTLQALHALAQSHSGKLAALMLELVQGEGGYQFAPREFYVQLFEAARKLGLCIWVDEVQTFGRTGELFAYQKFQLNPYVDVVTVGKMLQACLVLFTKEYNPKPGLISGTFSGSTVALRIAKRILEILDSEGFLGPEGKIEKKAELFSRELKKMAEGSCKGLIHDLRLIGGMMAFIPFQGKLDEVKKVLYEMYDKGVVAYYCGHGPYLIRSLAPLGILEEDHILEICGIIEKAILKVKKEI